MRAFSLLLCTLAMTAAERSTGAEFRQQWYDQGAEITRYTLQQSRYGELREGNAVLIYVTEPFDTHAQVKSDNPNAPAAVPVLKLNATRNFLTGVYPYSVMTSVFQPIDGAPLPRALKATTSIQEWCGQAFEQLNRVDDGWHHRLFSYFQSAGDRDERIAESWLEEELWTQIRIDPRSLPTGSFSLLPGAVHRRLTHQPAQAITVTGAWVRDGQLRTYTVVGPGRTVSLRISASFPYTLHGWTEKSGSAVTTATMTDRAFMPYWQLNRNVDVAQRQKLGLPLRP